jgi:hypothetical protein
MVDTLALGDKSKFKLFDFFIQSTMIQQAFVTEIHSHSPT